MPDLIVDTTSMFATILPGKFAHGLYQSKGANRTLVPFLIVKSVMRMRPVTGLKMLASFVLTPGLIFFESVFHKACLLCLRHWQNHHL